MTLKPLAGSLADGGVAHFWRDTPDGSGEIITAQDLGAVLDANRSAYDANDGYSRSRDLRRVAFVPQIILQKWQNEEGWDGREPEFLRRKLNDPDWRYLRTAPGHLGATQDGGFR